MLRDRITSLRNANEFNLHYDRHVVSSMRVQPPCRDTCGTWQANYAVFQTTLEGQSRLFSVGRYQDQSGSMETPFCSAEKFVVVDTFSVPTLLATPI